MGRARSVAPGRRRRGDRAQIGVVGQFGDPPSSALGQVSFGQGLHSPGDPPQEPDPVVRRRRLAEEAHISRCAVRPRSSCSSAAKSVSLLDGHWFTSFQENALGGFDLPPCGRASARPIPTGQMLGHHAFVALGHQSLEEAPACTDDSFREDQGRFVELVQQLLQGSARRVCNGSANNDRPRSRNRSKTM